MCPFFKSHPPTATDRRATPPAVRGTPVFFPPRLASFSDARENGNGQDLCEPIPLCLTLRFCDCARDPTISGGFDPQEIIAGHFLSGGTGYARLGIYLLTTTYFEVKAKVEFSIFYSFVVKIYEQKGVMRCVFFFIVLLPDDIALIFFIIGGF